MSYLWFALLQFSRTCWNVFLRHSNFRALSETGKAFPSNLGDSRVWHCQFLRGIVARISKISAKGIGNYFCLFYIYELIMHTTFSCAADPTAQMAQTVQCRHCWHRAAVFLPRRQLQAQELKCILKVFSSALTLLRECVLRLINNIISPS